MSKEHKAIISDEPMKMEWEDGHSFEFKHFEPKETNLIKIRMAYQESDPHEGIWACISDEDKVDYDNDVKDEEYNRVALLRNASLMGLPWGAYVPIKMNGTERPISHLEGLVSDVVFNQVNTVEDGETV